MRLRRKLDGYEAHKVFFTSDEHYFHTGILKHCNRPYSSVLEMNSALIDKFNEVVPADGITFHLGDFTFADRGAMSEQARAESLLEKLNGTHAMVVGNHDIQLGKQAFGKANFQLAPPYLELLYNNQLLCLSHYPFESWNGRRRGSLMLHGHCHGKSQKVANRIDVGVDCNDYRPISLAEVLTVKVRNEY